MRPTCTAKDPLFPSAAAGPPPGEPDAVAVVAQAFGDAAGLESPLLGDARDASARQSDGLVPEPMGYEGG